MNVPEVAKHHDGLANHVCKGCCFIERLEELSEPTRNWPSATAAVIPEVLARLERDGLPLLASFRPIYDLKLAFNSRGCQDLLRGGDARVATREQLRPPRPA